jgi:putative ABC transport system permease protein
MMVLGQNSGGIMVKVKTDDIPAFIESAKQKWATYNLQNPFSWYFLDDRFAALYASERKTGKLFTFLTVVAVVIACMGLVGLVAFTTHQRTKEIGVRKVLGASVRQVLILLAREFLWLVSLAFLISVPLTWWAMHAWLNNFAYRITMAWWVFLLAGVAAIVIALIAISAHTIKAALSNPVKSLRAE